LLITDSFNQIYDQYNNGEINDAEINALALEIGDIMNAYDPNNEIFNNGYNIVKEGNTVNQYSPYDI